METKTSLSLMKIACFIDMIYGLFLAYSFFLAYTATYVTRSPYTYPIIIWGTLAMALTLALFSQFGKQFRLVAGVGNIVIWGILGVGLIQKFISYGIILTLPSAMLNSCLLAAGILLIISYKIVKDGRPELASMGNIQS